MSESRGPARRLPIGAEVVADGDAPGGAGVHFRVWAPRRRTVEVVVEGGPVVRLESERCDANASAEASRASRAEPSGWFSGLAPGLRAGARYRFRLDGGDELFPDPASRFQPDGPAGPSEVVDPAQYRWSEGERAWRGVELAGQVIYEMHVGTFTNEGTWAAATEELQRLRDVCTVVEVMPVADFPGEFGWGYDGVNLFAPTRLYGRPDDLRAFVDRAHGLGIGVILDVVYNHVGPDRNYLPQFSNTYFTDRYETDWGAPMNYDGPGSDGVREIVLANAGYWVDEFHMDGLRLDATQNIFDVAHDASPTHILAEIGQRVRSRAGGRATIVVVENEPQDTRLLRGLSQGGYGLDAAWNDDFHHAARVALTGHAEAYFTDYRGSAQEFVSAAKYGYLFQGQHYAWQDKRRGSSSRGLAPAQFVAFLENHDQVANSASGARVAVRAHPGRLRALRALVMLGPATPMIFQGEEFGSTSPFLYFAHHTSEVAASVCEGRADFLAQFPSIALPEVRGRLDDPCSPATFAKCKLDPTERARNTAAQALHHDLFALRRSDPTLRAQGRHGVDGAVVGPSAFVLRLFGEAEALDRLLVVNLGVELALAPASEPLLGAPAGLRWWPLWSSEDPRYGGDGMPPPVTSGGWRLTGESAVLLALREDEHG